MFCMRRGKPALLVWYKDPVSVAHEMRPPSIQLWEEISLYDREIGNPMFSLITHNEEFHVTQGPLRVESDGKTIFEDIQNDEQHYLDFQCFVDKNKRLITRALSCNEQKEVPDFHSEDAALVKPQDLSLDAYWVGALAVSRAEVTQFLIYYMTADMDMAEKKGLLQKAPVAKIDEVLKKKVKPTLDAAVFFCWYPTGKPGNLQNWLHELKNGVNESQKERVYTELSPIIEGFYRVAPVEKPTDSDERCTIMYDDVTLMQSSAYFDTGSKTDDPDSGFFRPYDKHRGKLTISTPLCLTTPNDKSFDWGFTGINPLGWLFLLPLRSGNSRKYLFGPVRVSTSGFNRFKTHLSPERKAAFRKEGVRKLTEKLFKPLTVDAELNLGDMPTTTLLSHPTKRQKSAMKVGIERTGVSFDAIPTPKSPRRGKSIALPRRLLVNASGESGEKDDGETQDAESGGKDDGGTQDAESGGEVEREKESVVEGDTDAGNHKDAAGSHKDAAASAGSGENEKAIEGSKGAAEESNKDAGANVESRPEKSANGGSDGGFDAGKDTTQSVRTEVRGTEADARGSKEGGEGSREAAGSEGISAKDGVSQRRDGGEIVTEKEGGTDAAQATVNNDQEGPIADNEEQAHREKEKENENGDQLSAKQSSARATKRKHPGKQTRGSKRRKKE